MKRESVHEFIAVRATGVNEKKKTEEREKLENKVLKFRTKALQCMSGSSTYSKEFLNFWNTSRFRYGSIIPCSLWEVF